MKIKTSVLTGPALDWVVASLEFPEHQAEQLSVWVTPLPCRSFDEDDNVFALHRMRGRTPLRAAMRCYVASKLGDTVDIPEELL